MIQIVTGGRIYVSHDIAIGGTVVPDVAVDGRGRTIAFDLDNKPAIANLLEREGNLPVCARIHSVIER